MENIKTKGSDYNSLRPKSLSTAFSLKDEDDLKERQRLFDSYVDREGANYSTAAIRALKFIQHIPEGISTAQLCGSMLHILINKKPGYRRFWLMWMWLTDFNYVVIRNWIDNLLTPSFVYNARDQAVLLAVCDALLKRGNWKPGTEDTCCNCLNMTIEVASTNCDIRLKLENYDKDIESMLEVDAAAFNYIKSVANALQVKPDNVFEWFKYNIGDLFIPDLEQIAAQEDNMSELMEIDNVSSKRMFKELMGINPKATVVKRAFHLAGK